MTQVSESRQFLAAAKAQDALPLDVRDLGRSRFQAAVSDLPRLAMGFAIGSAVVAVGLMREWRHPELGRHPDEAGHFITGTLVHDWVARGMTRPPLEFGLLYYARYPKVAFGHWPPLFYVVQALWYGAFGVSRQSAVLLTAAVSGASLVVLYRWLRCRVSRAGALAAVGLVIASPVFRYSSSLLMADLLTGLFVLAALWCYARFLDAPGLGPALGFGASSALAILTKQDAIALGAVPLLAVVLLRRWRLLRDWRFYVPALVVLSVCAPLHLFAFHAVHSAWAGLSPNSPWDKAAFVASGLCLTGASSWVMVILGMLAITFGRSRSPGTTTVAAVLFAHALGYSIIQMATPVSFDPRYKTTLLPLAAFLAALGSQMILDGNWGSAPLKMVALAGLVGLLAADHPTYEDRRVTGYRQLVGHLAEPRGLQVVLVCSDSMGDGAIVSEFRLQHPSGRFCVLRADKVLSSSTWMNQKYRLIHDNPQAIEDYLVRQPVHFVMIDDWGRDSGVHHEVLAATLKAHPDRFPLIGTFPVVRSLSGHEQEGEARLYRVAATGDTRPSAIQVHIPGMPGDGNLRVSTSDF